MVEKKNNNIQNNNKLNKIKLHEYLEECHKDNILVETQTKLGTKFYLSQKEVSNVFTKYNYKRKRNGTLSRKDMHVRQAALDALNAEMKLYVAKDSIITAPTIYAVNCDPHLADYLKSHIEAAFTNEVITIHTNESSLIIYVDSSYVHGDNEQSFADFIAPYQKK